MHFRAILRFTDWSVQSINYHIAFKAMFNLLNDIICLKDHVCNNGLVLTRTMNVLQEENYLQQ